MYSFRAFPQPQHSSGCISPTAPTAFNQLGHVALQMGLTVGWDCCGCVLGVGLGCGGSRNSQHICASSSFILIIHSRPVLRHLPMLDCLKLLGPSTLEAQFSKALTFPQFYQLTFSIIETANSVLKRALCAFGECQHRMVFYSLRKDGVYAIQYFPQKCNWVH